METQYIAPQIKIKEFSICQSLLGGMSMKIYNSQMILNSMTCLFRPVMK